MNYTILLYLELIHVFILIRTSNACGGNVDGRVGYITSPNYPNAYLHNLNCTWKVTGTAGSTFNLQFEKFDIICNDTVTIYDGTSISETTLLNKKCGIQQVNAIGTLKSTSNVITVQFVSDATGRSTGFYLAWNTAIATTTSVTTSEYNTDDSLTVTSPYLSSASSTAAIPTTTSVTTSEFNTDDVLTVTSPYLSSASSTATIATTTSVTTSEYNTDGIPTVTSPYLSSASSTDVSRRSNAMVTESTTRYNGFRVTTMTATAKVPVIVGAAVGGFVLGAAVTISITVCYLRRSRSTDKKKEGQYDTLNMNTSNTSAYTDLTEVSTSNMKRMNVNIDPNTQNEGETENAENHGHYQNIEVTEKK